MALADFLAKYDTIIFDMDGVITSEQHYWDVAALTVWELIKSDKYFGRDKFEPEAALRDLSRVRDYLFCGDKTIVRLKESGVNSNWDLAYVVFSSLISGLEPPNVPGGADVHAFELYDLVAQKAAAALGKDIDYTKREGELWVTLRDAFQEWYLGDEQFEVMYGRPPRQSGKAGLYKREVPIIGVDKLKRLLKALKENGKRLGVGTGRSRFEMEQPLKMWGVQEFFDPNSLCSFDHVVKAEEETGCRPLTKPHPYMFVKAVMGLDYPDEKIVAKDYPKRFERVLTVGDAGADILCAKAMGADFAAVLTGVSGKAARGYFETQKAEYILDDVGDFLV